MRSLRMMIYLFIIFSFSIFSALEAQASTGNLIPQGSNGLNVSVITSTSTQAILSADAISNAAQIDRSENPMADEEARPFSSGIVWALPLGTQAIQSHPVFTEWRNPEPGEISDSLTQLVLSNPLPLFDVCQPMIMRGIPLTSIAMNGLQPTEDGNNIRICTHLEISLDYTTGSAESANRVLSAAFVDVLRGMVANLDDVAPVPVHRPEAYLIITRPVYNSTALANFVAWKRQKGHTVIVATTDETGTTKQQIKAYIQNAYDTWDEPPVFITLIGDEDGINSMPTDMPTAYFRGSQGMASDLYYSLLEGTDYFPDVFVGRLSVDSETNLQTIVNKCVNYESNPYQPTGAWRTRMLITGVRSSATFYPDYNSSWPTLQWIGRQMTASGYTDIDEIPYPPGNGSQISSSINNGVSFAAYRGFGAPDMWDFPQFDIGNISSLTNGEKLPFVTSIVCGGGAFEDQTDPCFGEQWLRAGTPTNAKGAIGFIGPSEIDTKTRWNNTNVASIYEGILHEGVNTLSAAMLRGKMALYQEFPNNINNFDANSNTSVRFYFQTYNLLGDPGLNFFVGNVRDLTATVPSSLPLGAPNLDLTITENGDPLDEAWGTVTQNGALISRAISDPSGRMVLNLPQTGAGTYLVTLTKPRHMPHTYNLTLGQQNLVAESNLQIIDNGSNGSSGNGDGLPNPGERLALNITVQNFGTNNFSGGALTLSSENNLLTVISSSQNVPVLFAGQSSAPLQFLVDVSSNANDGIMGRLNWNLNSGQYTWNSEEEILSPLLSITGVSTDGASVNPEPGMTAHISLNLQNSGAGNLPTTSVILRSLDSRLTILDSTSNFPVIAANGSIQQAGDFQISVGNFYPGDWAQVQFVLTSDDVVQTVNYSLPIGNLEGSDPSHPDSYGYRAFQDGDTEYSEHPAYAWIEIDPAHGGSGTNVPITDTGDGEDNTQTINLPFQFSFYGQSYNEISICSNGFIAFGETDESYFRNYTLPAIASPDKMVCAFWDDLALNSNSHVCIYHDVAGGRFIIEWSRLQNQYSTHPEETFEIVLYNTSCWPTRTGDGDILIQYLAFNSVDSWDNYCTIGIQDRVQNYSLQLSYAGYLSDGMSIIRSAQAILFTTGRPTSGAYVAYEGNQIDDDSQGGSNGNGDGIPQNGETIQMQIRLHNIGNANAPASTGTLVESDPLVTILDSQLNFPAIPAGSEVLSNPVRVQLASNAPNGHVANFSLSLTGGAQPCVVLPSLIISGPFLSALPLDIDDDNIPPSIGNNNDEFNPLETIELTPSVTNLGAHDASGVTAILRRQSNNISILDSTAAIGNVALNGQVTATDPFVLHINNGIHDGAVVQLQVVLRDQFGVEWTQPFSYTVAEPIISSSGLHLTDPAPGGNDDGRLVPGETAEIFPRIANTGSGAATNVQLTLSTTDSFVTLQNPFLTFGTVSGNSVRESDTPIGITVSPESNSPRSVVLHASITGDDGINIQDNIYLLVGNAIFFSDFEGDNAGWMDYGSQNPWHVEQRLFSSPSHAFYCGNEGSLQYPTLCDAYLLSPAFNYNGVGTLIYTTRYNTYNNADVCTVQLQTGPSIFNTLEQYSGDSISSWNQHQISLSGFSTYSEAHIRFWFRSNASGQAEGWYVDDVILLDQEVAVDDIPNGALPQEFALEQNYPNPFNNETTLQYSVPQASRVRISLYDILGREVATLLNENKNPGTYSFHWQPLSLASGIYFIRLDANQVALTRKIMLLK